MRNSNLGKTIYIYVAEVLRINDASGAIGSSHWEHSAQGYRVHRRPGAICERSFDWHPGGEMQWMDCRISEAN
jgi:hypothetical protein